MEGMKEYPDKFFDLAIVDPPFGLNEKLKGGKTGFSGSSLNKVFYDKWDFPPSKTYFCELFRISKNQIIWGGNYFIEHLHNSQCFLIWDKMNGTNNLADAELAWTSFCSSIRIFRNHHFSSGNEKKIHPIQKPRKLYRWILKNYALPGDILIDTHVGSASSLIEFEANGFDYVGFEINKDYYEAAQKRIKQFRQQPTLWEQHKGQDARPDGAGKQETLW